MAWHTLKEGAGFFTGVATLIPDARKRVLGKAATVIKNEAKRVLGTYDYGWEPLAESTVDRKETGDSPGLETGRMRDSIQSSVDAATGTATVGSNDPHALYFELGTVKQPARSFLAGAAMRKEAEVRKICGHDLFASVTKLKLPDDDYEGPY
jgi:phage gpG-like protein